jgi:plasmid stabilization system protein ParE
VDLRLQYTQRALDDLAEIIGYIAEDDAEAASRFGGNLLDHVELLARFPRMGNIVPKRPDVRKLLHSPIFVYYRLREKEGLIEVLHLRHAARKPPKSFK